MKAQHIILLVICLQILPKFIKAQSPKVDSIFWENRNVSLLHDIDNAWIILKKGAELKNVRIREIKKEKGVLVYEKDKCLHDLFIHNIKRIQAGKNSRNAMFFYADNTPYIKATDFYYDANTDYTEFKSVKMPEKTISPKKSVEPTLTETLVVKSTACDTIIDLNGTITLAKIIEVNTKLISYKKISNPDGPVYIKANNNARISKYPDCISITFLNK